MTTKWADKVVLVTGGSSGIGRETARTFARKGAQVVVANRNQKEGAETIALIQNSSGKATFIQTDVSKEEEVKKLINQIVSTYGRLDMAFNNAGVQGPLKRLTDCTEEEFDLTMNVNLKGVWLLMKYEILQMLKQKEGGAIVNNTSIVGLLGAPTASFYSASKHGVEGLSKSAALEYAKSNIRINTVAPGTINTPMIDRYFKKHPHFNTIEEGKAAHAALHPIGRIGKPEEVAESVVWLCSNEASFITGHSLAIDGGFHAQ